MSGFAGAYYAVEPPLDHVAQQKRDNLNHCAKTMAREGVRRFMGVKGWTPAETKLEDRIGRLAAELRKLMLEGGHAEVQLGNDFRVTLTFPADSKAP